MTRQLTLSVRGGLIWSLTPNDWLQAQELTRHRKNRGHNGSSSPVVLDFSANRLVDYVERNKCKLQQRGRTRRRYRQ